MTETQSFGQIQSIFAVFNFSGDKRLGRAYTGGPVVVIWCVTLKFRFVLLNDGVVIVVYFSKSVLICVAVFEHVIEGLNCSVAWIKPFVFRLITGSTRRLLFMSISRPKC